MGNPNKSAEEEVERLRKQLDRANADFEEFVSMAAHYLRQSLRDVTSYSELMSETYASRLDSEAVISSSYSISAIGDAKRLRAVPTALKHD